MDIDIKPIADAVVAAAADAVKLASPLLAGGAIALGHRVWRWAGSSIHGTDVALIKGAVRTTAINTARSAPPDMVVDQAIDAMVAYTKRTVGRILTKRQVSDDTLRDMCAAALAEAIDTYQAAQAAAAVTP